LIDIGHLIRAERVGRRSAHEEDFRSRRIQHFETPFDKLFAMKKNGRQASVFLARYFNAL